MNTDTITFGGGCFWCIEAIFMDLKGVIHVQSGYAGGYTKNPTYHEVCAGSTGHAEVVQIEFQPDLISYATLLDVFWHVHDPTQLNRQGNDVGTQYRSVILYDSAAKERLAQDSKAAWQMAGLYNGAEFTTQIVPLEVFYPAEDYHANYFNLNPNQPYCSAVVGPKLAKFRKQFAELLS